MFSPVPNLARWCAASLVLASAVSLAGADRAPREPGLLFYLSGDHGLVADVAAGGDPAPNYAGDVRTIPDGAKGAGIECAHTQILSYWAPGNIYAQRGTLSFYWRSREPVGPTEFPIFRVGYGDHSSWDMVFLRIDYNGHGFDAFVTDASLARTRVSYTMPAFPAPKQWVHLALTWDETVGIRFYVDGQLAAKKDGVAIFDAALDQFGPHSRIIAPWQVQSNYNFVRGGDLDEIRVYDRMLDDQHVSRLARGEAAGDLPPLERPLREARWRDEWWFRNGWNRPGDVPPVLDAPSIGIRKVQIEEAYDLKRWWWKGTDGIRETTWPGVYNRSRLPGRNDYFQLPDWDCYSLSGKAITFTMPDEPWNQLEISGAAFGGVRRGGVGDNGQPLFERPKGQERTFHRVSNARGGPVTFTNVEQETPIGEFDAYYVSDAKEPDGIGKLSYRLSAAAPNLASLQTALTFLRGRHPEDERSLLVALPSSQAAPPAKSSPAPTRPTLPIVHILVPSDVRDADGGARRATFNYSWVNMAAGLDGIALDLPALKVTPTHGEYFPLRIQVKDPIWPLRNMMDVSVAVKPGEPHRLWLDLRDRILPNDQGLYLTISGAGSDFGPASLEGATLRLVFKARKEALVEHVRDRFTQVRDNYAQIVEESPKTRRLRLFSQFETDITDLLRADPDHVLGRQYWYDYNREQPQPSIALPPVPAGTPAWAFRQVGLLDAIRRLVDFYIDKRQIENGEFGGGLSDDGDLTHVWPATAMMGAEPAKIGASLDREMDAFYDEHMFTNGLSTIQTDELHSYEEGIQVLGQVLLLDHGSPRQLERAMETAAALEAVTGVNTAGHRHIRTAYFSGKKMALEGVWGWQKPNGFLVFQPAIQLVDYNGSPRVKKWLLELADGVLAHYEPATKKLQLTVEFATDAEGKTPDGQLALERGAPLLWSAYRWTGNRKYLAPLLDAGPAALPFVAANMLDHLALRDAWQKALAAPAAGTKETEALRHVAWQASGNVATLASLYEDQLRGMLLREYINTEGSLWIDRIQAATTEIQRARLGGVAMIRNSVVPGQAVSWHFAPGEESKVGILVPDAAPDRFTVIGYNMSASPIQATMSTWDVQPGTWEVVAGTRPETASGTLVNVSTRAVELERSASLPVTFVPGTNTVMQFRLVKPGVPYGQRPDLGIARRDVRLDRQVLRVTVHSLGAVAAPASRVVVRDAAGRELASASVPGLAAPVDLKPRSAAVALKLSAKAARVAATVTVETGTGVREITRGNNTVDLR